MNGFNVNMSNRSIRFDIKELGKQLKELGMLVLSDAVWNCVTVNHTARKTTWFYYRRVSSGDRFHSLSSDPENYIRR